MPKFSTMAEAAAYCEAEKCPFDAISKSGSGYKVDRKKKKKSQGPDPAADKKGARMPAGGSWWGRDDKDGSTRKISRGLAERIMYEGAKGWGLVMWAPPKYTKLDVKAGFYVAVWDLRGFLTANTKQKAIKMGLRVPS